MKAKLVLDKMPIKCSSCILFQEGDRTSDYCGVTGTYIDGQKKPDWCPLEPINDEIEELRNKYQFFMDIIRKNHR